MSTLQGLRHGRFLTQDEIARELEMPVRTYARWEQGVVEPRYSNLRKLARFFDVDPEDFFADEVAA